jgi:hypothetical protein
MLKMLDDLLSQITSNLQQLKQWLWNMFSTIVVHGHVWHKLNIFLFYWIFEKSLILFVKKFRNSDLMAI